jgi:hypothetical protein
MFMRLVAFLLVVCALAVRALETFRSKVASPTHVTTDTATSEEEAEENDEEKGSSTWASYPSKFANGSWDCNRPWPEMELFLPLATHYSPRDARYYEYETLFLRSLLLFYPLKHSNSSLRLLFDAEHKGHGYTNEIVTTFESALGPKKMPGGLAVTYAEPSEWYHRPTDRQQLLMMWADNFTSSEYVAFVDSDAVFFTAIDREDLFEDGKPVVNAKTGPYAAGDFWGSAPESTYDTLHLNETMRCMSYFPVVIKTSHLPLLRDYIVQAHGGNKTFNEIYKEVTGRHHCFFQFNAMCTFLFNYHQDEYKWYAHPIVKEDWDGKKPPANLYQNNDFSVFKDLQPAVFQPKPRIATHARYRSFSKRYMGNIVLNRIHMNLVFQQGMCLSPPLITSSEKYTVTHTHRDDPVCEHVEFAQKPYAAGMRTVKDVGYFEESHVFEYFDWTDTVSDKRLREEHNKRVDRIKDCRVSFDKGEYKTIMRPPQEMSDSGWGRRYDKMMLRH